MGRLTAVSFRPYRNHQFELRDGGGSRCAVIIHPPTGKGDPFEVPRGENGPDATLGELIARAKGLVDAVLGPRPPPPARGGHGFRRER